MERYLENLEAWCWRYLENARNYPGLHFTARNSGLQAIRHCLEQLRGEGAGSSRTATLSRLLPEDEAAISGGQRFICYARLKLALHAESEELRQFSFRIADDTVYFDFAERYLADFQEGLGAIEAGAGDYSISPKHFVRQGRTLGELDRASEDLWFWPCFGHLYPVR